jgi:O-antigen/teichoic acid export membrane protein
MDNACGRSLPQRAWSGILALVHPATALSRFRNDTLWSLAGNVVMQSLSFCATLMIARLLTKQEFGQYAVFLSSVALLGTLAGLGLGVAITTTAASLRKAAPRELAHKLAAAYWIGAIVTVGLSAVVIFAWALTGDGLLQTKFTPLFAALAVATLAVNTASMLQGAELSGYQSFRALAFAQGMRGMALLPLCVAAAVVFGLPGVITAAAAATGAGVLVQALMLSSERRRRAIVVPLRPKRSDMAAMLSCSAPAFFLNVFNVAGNWGGNVVVALSGAAGLAAVAEYGAAGQVHNILLFLPNIVGQVLMPTIANIKTTQRREGRRLVYFGVAAGTGVALLLASVITVFRQEVALLCGPAYARSSGTVALIAAGGVLYVAQSIMSYALIGYGYIRWVCLASAVAAATFITLAASLIAVNPGLGSRALGCAYISACTIQILLVSARFNSAVRSAQTAPQRN